MSGPYFVETLARNGDVLHRHQLPALPIRIGRGYDNDYIVDDAFAAPKHALVEADDAGQMQVRDLDTRNGIIHRGKRCKSLAIDGDTVFRIGHTNLRVRSIAHVVEPELVDRTRHGWEGALPGLVGLLLIALFIIATTWVGDTQSFQPIRYLQAMAFAVGGGLGWAGLWAFANRLFGRHARLGRHLFILGAALAALFAYKALSSVIAYAFSLPAMTAYGSVAAIAIVCVMLFHHLSTIKPHHPRRFAILCALLFVIGSGLSLLGNDQRSGRLADDLYMSLILPPSMRVSPDHRTDEFMAKVDGLKARLDVERTKKVKDEGGDLDED